MPRMPAPISLKGKALQLLATRDYSRAEMERRLRAWLHQQQARAEARPAARRSAAKDGHAFSPDNVDLPPATSSRLRWSEDNVASSDLPDESFGNDAPPDPQQAIHAVLDEMEQKGWLSDRRAAQSLVHRRAGRLGASRIAQELRRKGLEDTVIAAALADLRGSELERAHAVWNKKFGQPPASPAERARQMRFLASRGFGMDTIRHVLQGLHDDLD